MSVARAAAESLRRSDPYDRVLMRRWTGVPGRCLLGVLLCGTSVLGSEKNELSATRLLDSVRVLASDAMEGRGPGTQGLDAAAQYIADQFAAMGLRTNLCDGAPFQAFDVPAPPELGPAEANRLVLGGPGDGGNASQVVCALGQDFTPLAAGGSGTAQGPLAFVGYGITAPDWKYDDYAGIDVQGKIVVLLRKEPQQGDATSLFNGLQTTEHASFRQKIQNARAHGAAGVIIVNDAYSLQRRQRQQQKEWQRAVDNLTAAVDEFKQLTSWSDDTVKQTQAKLAELAQSVVQLREAAAADTDELVGFREAGGPGQEAAIPVYFCRRTLLDPLVKRVVGTDLSALEARIDQGLTPQSRDLAGWTAECQVSFVQISHHLKNVVGVREGSGPLAEETIVIGAHYDHLGRGGAGGNGEIHNGADDNASGVSGILEIARRLTATEEPSRRRLVFIAFAGEELGLLGSAHYAKVPLFPLDKTVAMINLDMIGRLRDNKLTIGGTGSAAQFDALLEELNAKYQFQIARMPNGQGPSDHASFYRQKVPVLFFYTNDHEDYHHPTDDVEKINVEGMLSITDFVTEIVDRLDDVAERPSYQETTPQRRGGRGTPRPYLGCVPDASATTEGVTLLSVAPASPAEQAGLQPADVLLKFGDAEIRSFRDLDQALRARQPGDVVPLQVRRGSTEIALTVTLAEPK